MIVTVNDAPYLIVHTECIHWTYDTDHLWETRLTAEWLQTTPQNEYKINKEYTALNLHRIKQSLYSNLKQGIYCTNNCECSLKIPLHYTFLSDTGSR